MRFLISALTLVALVGCGSDKDSKSDKLKTFDRICKRNTELIKSRKAKNWSLVVQNAVNSCAAGCDLKHQASCDALAQNLEFVCGASAKSCASICKTESPSLKKYACPLAAKKPASDSAAGSGG